MNLIITDICNRSCPYCFAALKTGQGESDETMAPEQASKNLSDDDFERYLDFLKASGEKSLKLLGGEPTVHPNLPNFVRRGIEEGLEVTIFSNGVWSEKISRFFADPTTDPVSFLINVNEVSTQTDKENKAQEKSLSIIGPRGQISFNIYNKNFDLTFVIDLINRYKLKREVRLGLTHPIVGADNVFIEEPGLKLVGRRLVEQLDELEKHDILGAFDCGFPLCMFDEDQLGRLVTTTTGVNSICETIVDVGVDLTVWPCFPLTTVANVSLNDYPDRSSLVAMYDKILGPVKRIGSMDECLTCKYLKRGQCCGGCMGRSMINLQQHSGRSLVDQLSAPRS